jgi:hypothetical protein
MQQTMRPAAPPTHKAPNAQDKPLALLTNNDVQTSEPFVTPDRMDEVNKEQTQVVRRLPRNVQAQALGTDLFVSFVEQNGLKDILRFSFTSLQIDGRVLRPTQTTGVPTLPFIRRNH